MNGFQHILIFGVRIYRWILSPAKTVWFGPPARCRFSPSCSEYAGEALRIHGAWRGGWLAVRRLCRCHPWGDCGHDPVPDSGRPSRPATLESTHLSDRGSRDDIALSGCRPGRGRGR